MTCCTELSLQQQAFSDEHLREQSSYIFTRLCFSFLKSYFSSVLCGVFAALLQACGYKYLFYKNYCMLKWCLRQVPELEVLSAALRSKALCGLPHSTDSSVSAHKTSEGSNMQVISLMIAVVLPLRQE